MAQRQRQRGSRRTPAPARHKDNEGIVPVLARAVRELESAVQRGPLSPGQRTRFQVVALLAREHRNDVKASAELNDAQKADELKRLDGIATILAKTATRDPALFTLLSEDAGVSDGARELRLEMLPNAPPPAAALLSCRISRLAPYLRPLAATPSKPGYRRA